MPRLPTATAEAVQADGLPRVATADDGTQHVLYLDGAAVRSMLATDWPPPLPTEPTPAESTAATQTRQQAETQRRARAAAARERLRDGRARLRAIVQAADALSTTNQALTVAQTRQLAGALRDVTRAILDTELVLALQADDGED